MSESSIDFGKDLKVNEYYHIDKQYANGCKVKLIKKGKIYGTVEDPDTGAFWETMLCRLSPLDSAGFNDKKI